MLPWRIINHVQADQITKVPTTDVPLDLYLSVLGMPGQTAYHGLLDIDNLKPVILLWFQLHLVL